MREYGLGMNLTRLLEKYCKQQRIIPKASKYLETVFKTGRVVTQGEPAPPMILNIVVDAVVRLVLDVFCSTQEA